MGSYGGTPNSSTLPTCLTELSEHAARTRGIERSFTGSDAMVGALAEFAGPGGPSPNLGTDVFDIRERIDRVVAELEQPIKTAAIGGIALGSAGDGCRSGVRRAQT